uniref:Uncharacterized protein n=1 Tax=Calidris pygmaea TaxID=425635 RepID=A0A8C3JW48_9CHAR
SDLSKYNGFMKSGTSLQILQATGPLTSSNVKCTGSVRYTRLDSLLIEAAMTWELTAIVLFRPAKSLPSFMVAFSVLRKRPKLL